MTDLRDGESAQVQGSARAPYILKNVGGVYSCTCPAWRNQSLPIKRRTCKHLRGFRGEQAERERLGSLTPLSPASVTKDTTIVPKLLLAHPWDNDTDLTGWWLSEKLDGVRAWWDGHRFLSRQGNVYHAPAWFSAGLPSVPLDGELWLDRKAFQRTVSIVRRHDQSDHWRQISFVAFDAPAAGGQYHHVPLPGTHGSRPATVPVVRSGAVGRRDAGTELMGRLRAAQRCRKSRQVSSSQSPTTRFQEDPV
jgi:DNA ligase-1